MRDLLQMPWFSPFQSVVLTIIMSCLLTVRSKCALAAAHAAPWWVTLSMPTGQTHRRADVRRLHYAFRHMRSA